jgi:beta-glucosidase
MTVGGGSSELKAKWNISVRRIENRYKNASFISAMGYASGPSAYDKVIPSTLDQNILKQEAWSSFKSRCRTIFLVDLTKNHLQDCEGR